MNSSRAFGNEGSAAIFGQVQVFGVLFREGVSNDALFGSTGCDEVCCIAWFVEPAYSFFQYIRCIYIARRLVHVYVCLYIYFDIPNRKILNSPLLHLNQKTSTLPCACFERMNASIAKQPFHSRCTKYNIQSPSLSLCLHPFVHLAFLESNAFQSFFFFGRKKKRERKRENPSRKEERKGQGENKNQQENNR